MKLEKLKQVVVIKDGGLRLAAESLGEPFSSWVLKPLYQNELEITQAKPAPDGTGNLIIEGKTSFPLLGGISDVRATFEDITVDEATEVCATLRFKVPGGWVFSESFPDLPRANEQDMSVSMLDAKFSVSEGYFYLTTHYHPWKHDSLSSSGFLVPGLNFVGRAKLKGDIGFFQRGTGSVVGGDELDLWGPVIFRPMVDGAETPLPAVPYGQLPGEALPRIPGIHLQVGLGSAFEVPLMIKDVLDFEKLRLQLYCPLSVYWRFEEFCCPPEVAFLGELLIKPIQDAKLAFTARQVGSGEDELEMRCQFVNLHLANLLKALTGKDDGFAFLPDPLKGAIGNLGPRETSFNLVRSEPGKSYEVALASFTIGMEEGPVEWSPFGEDYKDFLRIGFDSVTLDVIKPFDSTQRSFFANIQGTFAFLGAGFLVRVEAPSLRISAEQIGTKEVTFKSWCDQLGLPSNLRPPDFRIANVTLAAQPGSYYAFSMDIAPNQEWKIEGKTKDQEYSLPTVRFGVSCATVAGGPYWGWQFEASTEGKRGVPVSLLIERLAHKVGVTIPDLPKAIEELTIESLALAYDSESENLGFECRGTLPLNQVTLNCGFTIEHAPAIKDRPSNTEFGGQVLVTPTGQEPLSFSLKFRKEGDSKYCVAAYNDPFGHELNIKDLASSISEKFASYIPPSLRMTLTSALLAYYSKAPAEKLESGSGAKPVAETVVLFGVDLGAKVKLSDLPLVGRAMPEDQAIGFESLRIIVASAALEQESVDSLDEILLDKGIKPLSDMSGKGEGKGGLQKFNITAELLFGSLSRTLSLPVEGGVKESRKEPTAVAPPAKVEGAGSPAEATDATKWFEIEKSMGPVTVRRVGLGYEEGRVGIKFDASLQLNVLTFNLEGLGLTYPLDKFTEPSEFLKHVKFNLDGMGLALGNGPIEIGGSLVRIPRKDLTELELEGTLLIRTAPFTFSAFGSYVELLDGTSSVMAFAVLLMELGDPTGTGAFVVTGLAFGFGVNRKLTLPRIEEVHTFPLIQAAMGKQDFADLQKLPKQLRPYVVPSPGNFWVAAGLKFNSFGMVDSFLLVSVSFGAEVEIGLLGLSRMTTPPMVQPDRAIASAELALRGVINIAEGLIQFEAQLTDNSFIFSKNCRLTGGFAACVWFAGPQKGDFVISLGGYHPAFKREAHYPFVPRLGMQLQIGTELSITGEVYFALTPFCIMAGGKLCAVFQSGCVRAWFVAYADFLMSWQPFYYTAEMGIALGIDVGLRIGSITISIRVELSVQLQLWGQPFGGEAIVDLTVISFRIPFGDPIKIPDALTVKEFITAFLPPPREAGGVPDVIAVRINNGLLKQCEKGAEKKVVRVVNAHELSMTVESLIPSTGFEGLAKKASPRSLGEKRATDSFGIRPMAKRKLESKLKVQLLNEKRATDSFGIRPMAKRKLESKLKVQLLKEVEGEFKDEGIPKNLRVSFVENGVPDALWGQCEVDGQVALPGEPKAKPITATVGVRFSFDPIEPEHALFPIPLEKLKSEQLPTKTVKWDDLGEARTIAAHGDEITFWNTIWDNPGVNDQRNAILDILGRESPFALNKSGVAQLHQSERDYFQADPEFCALGEALA